MIGIVSFRNIAFTDPCKGLPKKFPALDFTGKGIRQYDATASHLLLIRVDKWKLRQWLACRAQSGASQTPFSFNRLIFTFSV